MASVQDLALAPVLLLSVALAMRWLVALLAWAASAALLAPVCFFGVMLLAGPHSSLLPSPLQGVVLIFGWLVLLIVPILLARAVWRRMERRRPEDRPEEEG